MLFKDKLIKDRIPKHVAIIMDGNGRWAAQFGNERTFGHEHGVEAVRSVVKGAGDVGVGYLTLYAFSTENWARPKLNDCTGLTLVLALSYSSKWEIVEAVKRIAEQVKLGKVEPSEIDYDLMNCFLNTSDMPDPELLIRTSGECRISNFLLWQIAYSELYFTPKLWPDFREEDLFEAIYDFQNRERRFGKTSQQLVS